MNNLNTGIFYENATHALLSQIVRMKLKPDEKRKAVLYTKLFREAFKYDAIKKYVFPADNTWNFGYDSAGFCYASSVVFAIMNGVKNWNLMYIDENNWSGALPHYYLQHSKNGDFFDITYDQFAIDGLNVPYEIGEKTELALVPGDPAFKFADALSFDIVKTLFNKRRK